MFISSTCILFNSCEKDIEIGDLPRPEKKITIEGFIDLDQYPIVFLTKNSAYFDIVDTTFVKDLIISDDMATVIVDNGIIFDTLRPDVFEKWPYKGYIGTKIKGQINGRYNLKVLYNGSEYTSSTTIKDTIAIDTVWYSKFFMRDTLGYLNMKWRNPVGYGDYFTITVKAGNEQKWFYRASTVHVIDDKLLENNRVITTPYVVKGYDKNDYFIIDDKDLDWLDFLFFKKGDTVSLKLSTIDETSYLFWNSWYRNQGTDGNPFTNPASVKSNIVGKNVNGYWIGYGAYIKTYYINDEYKVIPIN